MEGSATGFGTAELRVLAVSAPHWERLAARRELSTFNSAVPFSLQNAVRYAAYLASERLEPAWANSNWRTLAGRSASVLMYTSLEDCLTPFIDKLSTLRPHLLLLGAMTLSYPGAVQLARVAKELLREKVVVVLGGKHANETVYLDDEGGRLARNSGSPIEHLCQGHIPPVFDLVLSGDAEEVIAELGVMVSSMLGADFRASRLYQRLNQLEPCGGEWLAAWVDDGQKHIVKSPRPARDVAACPSTLSLFGTTACFDVFQRAPTVHAYAYSSKGCPLNCDFCSERRDVNGRTRVSSENRELLLRQFLDADGFGRERGLSRMAVFVEDSIFLGGSVKQMDAFADALSLDEPRVEFGIQLTVDILLRDQTISTLRRLAANGLTYVAVGIETWSEHVARRMDKNKARSRPWRERTRRMMQILTALRIKCGVYVLWGLGETQTDRRSQLLDLRECQRSFNNPAAVGLNWAVEHPLRRDTGRTFLQWGTAKNSPYVDYLVELFGESSERYCLPGVSLPTIGELQELKALYTSLQRGAQACNEVSGPAESVNPNLDSAPIPSHAALASATRAD